MRIVKHVWQAEIGRMIATMLIHQRAFAQEQADFAGVTLEDYVALSILEYLDLNHGDSLEIVEMDAN